MTEHCPEVGAVQTERHYDIYDDELRDVFYLAFLLPTSVEHHELTLSVEFLYNSNVILAICVVQIDDVRIGDVEPRLEVAAELAVQHGGSRSRRHVEPLGDEQTIVDESLEGRRTVITEHRRALRLHYFSYNTHSLSP